MAGYSLVCMFDTKIAVLLRDDLASWQRLNVTAFLVSGLAATNSDILKGARLHQ